MPTITLNNPTEDGTITKDNVPIYTRDKTGDDITFGRGSFPDQYRGYAEWDISAIPDGSTITKVEFRYNGKSRHATPVYYIYAMANQPSAQPDNQAGNQVIWDDAGDGVAYLFQDAVFPEVGVNKDVGGATGPAWDTDPKAALEAALASDWFAIGFNATDFIDPVQRGIIYSEEKAGVTPPPTLYVEYTIVGWVGKIMGIDSPINVAKINGVLIADIDKIMGVG